MLRKHKKFLSVLLALPLFILFVFCCCVHADASIKQNKVQKPSCSACPQKDTSKHQADCPHAKIKADSSHLSQELLVKKILISALLIFPQTTEVLLPPQISLAYTASPPKHSSLHSQNPILRL